MRHDADVKLIEMFQMPTGEVQMIAKVYNDSKLRFEDGDKIRTTYVVKITHDHNYMFVETRNTVYRIIGFED